jgi:hypothetical protein
MARIKEGEKSVSWNLNDKVTYKWLKAGAPAGFAYRPGDFAELSLTKEQQDLLIKENYITKV